MKELACILFMTACVAIPSAFAKGHRSTYAQGIKRDSHGHIARSESAKKQFEKQTGYPNGRHGFGRSGLAEDFGLISAYLGVFNLDSRLGSRSLTGRWCGKFSIKLPAEIGPKDVLWKEFSLQKPSLTSIKKGCAVDIPAPMGR